MEPQKSATGDSEQESPDCIDAAYWSIPLDLGTRVHPMALDLLMSLFWDPFICPELLKKKKKPTPPPMCVKLMKAWGQEAEQEWSPSLGKLWKRKVSVPSWLIVFWSGHEIKATPEMQQWREIWSISILGKTVIYEQKEHNMCKLFGKMCTKNGLHKMYS